MNRIQIGPLAKIPAPSVTRNSQPSLDSIDKSLGFEHSVFIPMHYESKYAYPLIVWLHSGGSDERQLLEVMPQISTRNHLGVAIAGPGEYAMGDHNWLQSPDSIETSREHVRRAIDLVACRFNVNLNRVFIAGSGCGGTMAFRLAFEQPEWFGGVASIGGSLPSTLTPLRNWMRCRDLPVFWSQSRSSKSFPEVNLCHQLRLLHIAGFSVTLRQYPGQDEMPDQCLDDLNNWVMEQIAKSGENSIIC